MGNGQGNQGQTGKQGDRTVRLVCTLSGASSSISGIAFASVALEEKKPPMHISERIDPARAEDFLRGNGFSIWRGNEDAHARMIEDALDAARRVAPLAGGAHSPGQIEQDLLRQIGELQATNQEKSRELSTAKREIRDLEAANVKLTNELNTLKATGRRAAA